MIDTILSQLISKHGLNVAVAAALIIIFWFILKWMARMIEKIIAANEKRELALHELLKKEQENMDTHCDQDREFHTEVRVAHDYQRKEHEKMMNVLSDMIRTLGRMNGNVHT